jgi:hypothetical protein
MILLLCPHSLHKLKALGRKPADTYNNTEIQDIAARKGEENRLSIEGNRKSCGIIFM